MVVGLPGLLDQIPSFKSYAKEHGQHIRSFDSDREWTDKTAAFLAKQELTEWATVEYSEAVKPLPPVDFIVWDFVKNPKCVDLMPAAFENLAIGGITYVDDMHSSEIARACEALGRHYRERCWGRWHRQGVFVRKAVSASTG